MPTILPLLSCLGVLLGQQLAPEVLAEARRIAAIAPSEHAPPPRTVDVVRYALHVAVDPATRAIDGRAEIELKTFGAPRRAIQLDADELAIQAVVDAAGQPLAFKLQGTTLEIDLGRDFAPDESTRLVVSYAAKPRRGLVFVDGKDGRCAMVWTQGECSMSSAWFPCRDYPDDRASSELFVTLPAEWKSVSNGVLIDSAPVEPPAAASPASPSRRVDHWRMDFPHPAYLTSMALGPFVEIDLGRVRDLPLLAYATADRHDDALLTLQPTGAMIERLERLTGLPYPYPAYRQVCVAEFPWEGMENIGATTLAQEALASPDRYDDEREAAEALVVHELAHQWFGDLVSPASWADLWLNEGFASFAEPWWLEQQGDAGGALAAWARMRERAVDHRATDPRPIVSATYVVPDDLFDATIYDCAGAFLGLLRQVAGPEKFDAGVKAWIAENQGRSVGTAEFEATFAKATGLPLADLFHEWLHSAGQPAIDFSWSFDEGKRRLELVAHQKQAGDGVPEVYHVPVDVAWQVGDQRRTTRMQLDARKCRVAVECDERPKYVRFNAGGALFGNLEVAQEPAAWRAQLALDSDPLGRIEAASALAEAWAGFKADSGPAAEANAEARRLTLAAISRALIDDPVIAVRAAAAAALGEVGGEVARTALGCALSDDEAPVRAAAAAALAEFTDDDDALGLLVHRFESEKSAEVRATALAGVARVAKARATGTLLQLIDAERAPPRLRGAALLALVQPEVVADLPPDLLAGAAERAAKLADASLPRVLRLRAIEALGKLAGRSDAACDALTRLLDDPSVAIVLAVLDALDDEERTDELRLRVVPALVAFHGKAPFDDQRSRIRTILRKLAPKLPP